MFQLAGGWGSVIFINLSANSLTLCQALLIIVIDLVLSSKNLSIAMTEYLN